MEELKKEEIRKQQELLAIILRNGQYPEGLQFYNQDNDFIQAGTWRYNKGQQIQAHSHRAFERVAERTQEVVCLKTGKMKSNIYDEEENLLTTVTLNAGDIIVYLAGGHDFEVLEDNTQVFEVKNGPYLGKEKDKKIIDNAKEN